MNCSKIFPYLNTIRNSIIRVSCFHCHELENSRIFSFFLRVPWHFFRLSYTPRMCFYFFFLSVAVFYFHLILQISRIANPDIQCCRISNPSEQLLILQISRIANSDIQCCRISNPSELQELQIRQNCDISDCKS